MLLFSMKNKIQPPALSSIKEDKVNLLSNGYLEYDGKVYKMTNKGKSLVSKINSYLQNYQMELTGDQSQYQ